MKMSGEGLEKVVGESRGEGTVQRIWGFGDCSECSKVSQPASGFVKEIGLVLSNPEPAVYSLSLLYAFKIRPWLYLRHNHINH